MLLKGLWKDFFFFLWYVFVALNGIVSNWDTQSERDITMDLEFFILGEVGGKER